MPPTRRKTGSKPPTFETDDTTKDAEEWAADAEKPTKPARPEKISRTRITADLPSELHEALRIEAVHSKRMARTIIVDALLAYPDIQNRLRDLGLTVPADHAKR